MLSVKEVITMVNFTSFTIPPLEAQLAAMPHEEIQWWNFHVPIHQQTLDCPDSLVHVSDNDKRLIGTWDSDYERFTWDEVKEIIGTLVRVQVQPLHHQPKPGRPVRDAARFSRLDSHRSQSFLGQNAIIRHAEVLNHPLTSH